MDPRHELLDPARNWCRGPTAVTCPNSSYSTFGFLRNTTKEKRYANLFRFYSTKRSHLTSPIFHHPLGTILGYDSRCIPNRKHLRLGLLTPLSDHVSSVLRQRPHWRSFCARPPGGRLRFPVSLGQQIQWDKIRKGLLGC